MPRYKTKSAKKLKEYDIDTYTKGFISSSIVAGNTVQEYFPFDVISQIIHHPGTGVEIVQFNELRKVFYNDVEGESLVIFNELNSKMVAWMSSNLN